MIGLPFVGVPVVRLAHRNGIGTGLGSAALAAALFTAAAWLSAGAADLVTPLATMGLAAVLPAFFSGLVRGGADPSREHLVLAVSGCVVLSALLLAPSPTGSPSVGEGIEKAFDSWIPGVLASYTKANVDAETLARVKATLEASRDFSKRYWLGLVAALWVLGSAITFYAGAFLARPAPSAERTRFEAFTLPALVAPAFVAAGAVWALSGGALRQVAGDVLIPLAALYFVAGLSIICHFARKWFRVRILRAGLYALVTYPPMNVGVALLGLFDWYANFRRRGEEPRRQT
jgi:predicted branched-subunit amino acid permease